MKDRFSSAAFVVALAIAGIGITGLFWWHTSSAQVPAVDSAPDAAMSKTYINPNLGYSLVYPAGFTVRSVFPRTAAGPDELVPDTAFRIPVSMVAGTNLLSDSHISVEWVRDAGECSALAYFHDITATSTKKVTENGVAYDFAKTQKEEAGNTYEEYVYALPGRGTPASPCLAVHYYIHSIDIDHYAPGTARQFDKTALLGTFDSVRHSLTLKR